MRFALVLASALAGLTMTAEAQKQQKPKAKPSHTSEKEVKGGGGRTAKAPAMRDSAAQDLRRVEQSSAKASASHKTQSAKAAGTAPLLKGEKSEKNPPINVAGGGGGRHGSKSSKSGDSTKGRLRHKGSHH